MGAVCCCLTVPESDGHGDENDSNHGNRLFINCCILSIRNKCVALFARQSGLPVPASNQGATSSDPVVPQNRSSVERSCERTLPMNLNYGYSPVPQNVVVRRQDKGSNHSRVEPEPLSGSEVQPNPGLLKVDYKLFNAGNQQESNCSQSSVKDLASCMQKGVGYDIPSSEDEDVCPTCLEEYTPENPKILTHCFHHYHLSCIYEWMERSETCPVCGKLMEFNETR